MELCPRCHGRGTCYVQFGNSSNFFACPLCNREEFKVQLRRLQGSLGPSGIDDRDHGPYESAFPTDVEMSRTEN